MIVIDTNVIAYLFMNGEFTQNAERLLKSDSQWCAPLLWRSEFRSILALYMRKKLLSLNQSYEIMGEAQKILKGNEYSVDSIAVLEKVNKCKLSAYDLEFVTLAESLKVKLITLDKKIINEFPKAAVSLREY